VRHGHDPLQDKFLQRSRLSRRRWNTTTPAPTTLRPIVLARVDGIIYDLPLARTVGA